MNKDKIKTALFMLAVSSAVGAFLGVAFGMITGKFLAALCGFTMAFFLFGILIDVIMLFTDIPDDFAVGFATGIGIVGELINIYVMPMIEDYVYIPDDNVRLFISIAISFGGIYYFVWKKGMKNQYKKST